MRDEDALPRAHRAARALVGSLLGLAWRRACVLAVWLSHPIGSCVSVSDGASMLLMWCTVLGLTYPFQLEVVISGGLRPPTPEGDGGLGTEPPTGITLCLWPGVPGLEIPVEILTMHEFACLKVLCDERERAFARTVRIAHQMDIADADADACMEPCTAARDTVILCDFAYNEAVSACFAGEVVVWHSVLQTLLGAGAAARTHAADVGVRVKHVLARALGCLAHAARTERPVLAARALRVGVLLRTSHDVFAQLQRALDEHLCARRELVLPALACMDTDTSDASDSDASEI